VSHLFSLSGNHIMAVYDALIGNGIRRVHTWHEVAAVHMADAFARLTGEVGVALVTGGPGHANAVSALLLAGPGALTRRGRALAQALEAANGVPVIGMQSPRGLADPSLGDFAALLGRRDAALPLGKRLDFTLGFGRTPTWRADARFAQIDPAADAIDCSAKAVGDQLDLRAVADLHAAMQMLGDSVASPARSARSGRWRWARAAPSVPTCRWSR